MENSLAIVHPELIAEWSKKNLPVTPDSISYGSNKLFWWKGKCGHQWQTSPKARSAGEKCPICANRKIVPGINDLKSGYPELMKEWSAKNTLDPEKTPSASHKKVWWKCSRCGCEWETRIELRTMRGYRCPYCAGKKIMPGYNDLATVHPELAEEWSERNTAVTPEMVAEHSDKSVWWKCKRCRHEWKARIADRSDGSGCPCCTYVDLIAGINDLKTVRPALYREWSARNGDLDPERTSPFCRRNVWWQCSVCGYEWKAVISSRVSGLRCPVCSGRKVMQGFNDLCTTDPDIVKDWDYSRNTVSPADIARHSREPVYWRCRHGHSFSRSICDYAEGQRDCPYCELDFYASLPMLAVIYYAGRNDLTAEVNSDRLIEMPVEACVPDIRLAVDIVISESRRAKVHQKWKRKRCIEKDITLAQIHIESRYDPYALLGVIRKAFARANIYIDSSEEKDLKQIRKAFDMRK